VVDRTLSPTKIRLQNGIDGQSHFLNVPRKRLISHTHPMWLWDYSLLKISPLYGARWLPRRPCKVSYYKRFEL
jgi:hypothetical protein